MHQPLAFDLLLDRRALFLFSSLFFCLSSSGQSGGGSVIPNGGFEDSVLFRENWSVNYGNAFLEDSIRQEGRYSLRIKAEDGHIDLALQEVRVNRGGTYKLSYWYRGKGVHKEEEPFWVEVLKEDGSRPIPFRFGKEEASDGLITREWVYFSEELELEKGTHRLYIHSDLSELWMDRLTLRRLGSAR